MKKRSRLFLSILIIVTAGSVLFNGCGLLQESFGDTSEKEEAVSHNNKEKNSKDDNEKAEVISFPVAINKKNFPDEVLRHIVSDFWSRKNSPRWTFRRMIGEYRI